MTWGPLPSKFYSEDYWYLYSLSVASMELGKFENAKRHLEKVISLKKYFAKAKRFLEQINAQTNKKTN